MNITKEEIQKFLKDSVEWLENQQEGCTTLKLDDRLAVCVGWLPGYGNEARDDVIQASDNPDWGINAGIKVWTSDDMRTDYEFINSPYYDNGDVVETDTSLDPSDKDNDFDGVADYLLKTYEGLYDLNIEEDGRVIEDNFEDSYEKVEEESLEEEVIDYKNKNEFLRKYGLDKYFEFDGCDLVDLKTGHFTPINFGRNGSQEEFLLKQIKEYYPKLFKKLKIELKEDKKEIKESWKGESVIDDLVERATSMIDEGEDVDDAVRQAIDDGLIYTDDIYELAKHYGSLNDSDIIESYYEDLYSDVYSQVEDYIPNREEDEEDDFEDDEETQEESLHESVEGLSLESPQFIDWKAYYLNQVCDGDEDEYNELYADSVEDMGGDEVCQAIYDLNLNGKKIGEIGAYLFDGMGMWYEIGLTNLEDEVESILDDESLEIQETDLGGYGWYPEEEKDENGYMKIYSSDEEFRKFLQPYVDKLAKLLK